MREKLRTYSKFFLLIALVAAFAWSVAPAGAQEEPGDAWCRPRCVPPTATATATPTNTPLPTDTPTPELLACQVTAVVFDRESYLVGDTIRVTVRVADSAGTPLVGANVNSEVTREPLQSQAATGFGLVDRAGDYDGVYTNTVSSGYYTFNFTVSDVTGERFLPCTGSAEVLVDALPTATPTNTPSPTPTNTPSPTPTATFTPTPTPALVTIPDRLETTLCSLRDTMQIRVDNVVNLAVVEMEITYDPAVIQVIDADAAQRGVQVRVDSVFDVDSIFTNEVDTTRGIISFGAGVIGVPVINGSSPLIAIDWRPQRVGSSAVTITSLTLTDAGGQTISAPVLSGEVVVNFVPNCLSGSVALEGRSEHGGVTVTNAEGDQTTTLPDGSYAIPASSSLTFEHAGFVPAQADLSQQTLSAAAAGQQITLQRVTLPAGDVNGDRVVNILDMAYLARHYGTSDRLADLNGDGKVDVLDLALCAKNYWKQGPVVSNQ